MLLVIDPPELDPILAVSAVAICTATPRTPLKVEVLINPVVSTEVPRIDIESPSLPIDPEGWHGCPAAHETRDWVRLKAAMLVLLLSTVIPLCGLLMTAQVS